MTHEGANEPWEKWEPAMGLGPPYRNQGQAGLWGKSHIGNVSVSFPFDASLSTTPTPQLQSGLCNSLGGGVMCGSMR